MHLGCFVALNLHVEIVEHHCTVDEIQTFWYLYHLGKFVQPLGDNQFPKNASKRKIEIFIECCYECL